MTERAVRYPEIVAALRELIASGTVRPGDRMPSEHQLARRFGVSRPTAGRALRELEAAGLVQRRAGSGTFARDAATGQRGRTFGLLAQGLGATEVLDPICTEITRRCQAEGSTVLWGDDSPPLEGVAELDRLCRYYLEQGVDGVFFAPLESEPDRERHNLRVVAALRSAGVQVVLLDRDVHDFPARSDLDLVGIDNFLAGLHLGEHLLALGRERLLLLARPNHPSTTDLRAAGCAAAARRHGLTPPSTILVSAEPADDAAVSALLADHRPDAIICANDFTAALLLQTLSRLEVRVPADVAVAGFDDVRYSTLLPVQLTTMRQPCRAIARAAVRVMNERLDDPSTEPCATLLRAELVVRRSCGSPAERVAVGGEEPA